MILLVTKKPARIDRENNIEAKKKGDFNLMIDKKVPATAMPNRAILIIIKAK